MLLTPRPTTFIVSPRLNAHTGLDLILASETFQHAGSFKYRGAFNTAGQAVAPHLIAASSGNFGQALALACREYRRRCTIVMPHDSSNAKIDAVREYGAAVEFVDTRVTPRAVRLAELLAANPEAAQAHPSDGELMLAGNESLGHEILTQDPAIDTIVAPIGGGGLIVGLIRAVRRMSRSTTILAAEPLAANDVAESFRRGQRFTLAAEPATLADGARVPGVSETNWQIIRDGCDAAIEVDEQRIAEAVRLLFTLANLKAEPTAALSLAAALAHRERFTGRRMCCVISGGNVDPAVYSRILIGAGIDEPNR